MTRKLFTIDEYVRWSDVDPAGIIFYGAYVRFFEIAETELFRSAGLLTVAVVSLAPNPKSPKITSFAPVAPAVFSMSPGGIA